MDWLTENWFWILIFVGFIVMHLFGHGSHGAHGHGNHDDNSMNLWDKKEETRHLRYH
jgi:hypothetical protein